MKKIRIIIVLLLCIATVVLVLNISSGQEESLPVQNQNAEKSVESPQTSDDKVELAMLGDMLPHSTISVRARQADGSYNYASLVDPALQSEIKKSEIRFCNQEVPASASFSVSGYPVFNADPAFNRNLEDIGCNVINVATNHTYDKGFRGLADTLSSWDQLSPLAIAGANRNTEESKKIRTFMAGGIRFGFTAFAEYSNIPVTESYSLNMLSNKELLSQQISELRGKSDVVMVSVHWGTEDSHDINSYQRQITSELAELGVDIVIGTGPHTLQPYDVITRPDGKPMHVWYSIGNGLNTQLRPNQLIAVIAKLTITKTETGIVISSPTAIPTYNHYNWDDSIGGTSEAELQKRYNVSFRLLRGSEDLLNSRKDFATTVEEQVALIRQYLGPKVEVL